MTENPSPGALRDVRRLDRIEQLEVANKGETLWCYTTGMAGKRADFSGGIKTNVRDDFETEFFLIDSGTRPDSAIPLYTAVYIP